VGSKCYGIVGIADWQLPIANLRIVDGGMPCCGCSGLLIAHCRFLIANRQLKDPPVSSNRQLAIGNRQ
jgi:hypothetical protein